MKRFSRARRRSLAMEGLEQRLLLAADMSLDFRVDGMTANVSPGVEFNLGATINGTYNVLNTGTVAFKSVGVVDDLGTPATGDDLVAEPVMAAPSALGTLEKLHSNLRIAHFVQHPTLPYVFASVWATNSIAVINTNSLALEALVPTGAEPRGVALSNDGTRLYVATYNAQAIAVMDTSTFTMLPSIALPEKPWDIEVGADGRLFVAGTQYIRQYDPVTGAQVGPIVGGSNGGELEINAQKTRLYYGNSGTSPATLVQYDLTASPPTVLWTGSSGASNGQDLYLSRDGQFLSFAAGFGQGGYRIAKYQTSNMAIVGAFETGPYPREIVYSPDNSLAYTSSGGEQIKVWNANTFLQSGTITLPRDFEPAEMEVDARGGLLYVATNSDLRIISTGVVGSYNAGDVNRNSLFDPGETWQFKSTTTAKIGQQQRGATATAKTAANETVVKTDPAYYFVNPAQLTLAALVQNVPVSAAPGPYVEVGQAVQWTFSVANIGQTSLINLQVRDDRGTVGQTADDVDATYSGGDANSNAILDPTETWQFTLSSLAVIGARQHSTRVTAQPADASGAPLAGFSPISSTRPSFHFGTDTRFTASATVNGQAVTSAPGPQVAYGDNVVWNYSLLNSGNVALLPPTVMDDGGTPITGDDSAVLQAPAAPTMLGTLEKLFAGLSVDHFVQHPTLPYLYASVMSSNSVAIINLNTLSLEDVIFIGAQPRGLALSNDGSRLFVALSQTNFIGVLDTVTRTVLPSLPVSEKPRDIEVGADGRLYVAGETYIRQIDPNTGNSVGPIVGGAYSGELEISPQKDRLYYGDFGLSPATMKQWDLTVDPPKALWSGGGGASNGQDVALSHDGQFISYAAGSGQDLYKIAKFRTSDMSIVGMFPTGAYPREVTYSADNRLAFTSIGAGQISVWDAQTFLAANTIPLVGTEVVEMVGDRSDARLFVATSNDVRIFSTGQGSTYNVGDFNRNGLFDPGETWQYRRTSSATAGNHQNVTAINATSIAGRTATGSVSTFYVADSWRVLIDASVAGNDADAAPGATFATAQSLNWQVQIRNPGLNALANVVVTDNNGTTVASDDVTLNLTAGDSNNNLRLDPGEVWSYNFSTIASAGSQQHRARVIATPVDSNGQPLATAGAATADDLTNYQGVGASLVVENAINGNDADLPPGLDVNLGAAINYTYQVTNTGGLPLAGVSVSDDRGTASAFDDVLAGGISAAPLSRGTLERTFSLTVNAYALHPTLPYLYASDEAHSAIAIINTQTLVMENLIYVGSGPRGLALSADGSRLYVANWLSQFVGVLDTQARVALPSLLLNQRPYDIKVGADGRLLILGETSIVQIDPQTGATVGPSFSGVHSGGKLAINPQKTRLYVADYGISPASLRQYDLTVSPPALLKTVSDGASNGQDLAISDDGNFISYAAGAGQGGYRIARYRTSDMTILGNYSTGPYPREITYSHDDTVAYTVHTSGQVDVWDTATFAFTGTIFSPGSNAREIVVDGSDGHLFAAVDNELRVYSTGRGTAYNQGDANRNRMFDPGETWSYSSSGTAAFGVHATEARATAAGPAAMVIEDVDLAHYVGIPTLQIVANPGTESLIGIGAATETFSTSDTRFEVVSGQLRLKAGQQLSVANDTGRSLSIYSSPGQVLVQKYVLSIIASASAWHNATIPTDVNGDGIRGPLDAILIINQLNANGIRTLASQFINGQVLMLDVNGDGMLAPLDALLVINHLNAAGVGEGESALPMPGEVESPVAAADEVSSPDDIINDASLLAYVQWLSLSETAEEDHWPTLSQ
jgi:YVTN family beta-propeller protein